MTTEKIDRISELISLLVLPEIRACVKTVRSIRWLAVSIILFTIVNLLLVISMTGLLLGGDN